MMEPCRFVTTSPDRVAPDLRHDQVHVWWLPYDRKVGRAPQRQLLATYLGMPPECIGFTPDQYGRPVSAHAVQANLAFNWSHSATHVLVALAHNLPELGVDLEMHRPRSRPLDLAQRFFAAKEHAWLAARDPAELASGFLQLWTAKEAVLKALGQGLGYGLHRVPFGSRHGRLQPCGFSGKAAPDRAWQVHALSVPGAWAHLAWRGEPRCVHLYRVASS